MKTTIHCSDTPNGLNYTIADITIWHIARGWDTCGYHYVIHIDGTVKVGREENVKGAHVKGHNKDNIGICLIGKDVFNNKQIESLVSLIQKLEVRYPDITIHGHYEFSNKTCPNFDVKEFCTKYNI